MWWGDLSRKECSAHVDFVCRYHVRREAEGRRASDGMGCLLVGRSSWSHVREHF